MKKIKLTFLLITLLTATSCEKFLEKNPNDFLYGTERFYNTEAGLKSSLASVYDRLGALHGTAWLYTLGIEADEGYYARVSTVGAHAYSFAPSDGSVLNIWRTLYEGIGRANLLLENVDNNPDIIQSYRNKIRGEALFLRGYFHFMLVQCFGGVPIRLVTSKDATEDMEKPRNTPEEVFDQIISDMTTAEGLVSAIDDVENGGTISKSAVQGLLARVYLRMAGEPYRLPGSYEQCLIWANKVKGGNKHGLNPDFTNIFVKYARDEYDKRESIWEVEYWGNRTDVFTETGSVGFATQSQNTNTLTGNGFGGLRVTPKLYRKYMPEDIRRDWTISNFNYNNTGANGAKNYFAINPTDGTVYNRNPGKFRREFETLLPKAVGATPQNFPLLRYSDILLMIAEAENALEPAPTPLAYDCINEVRRRAYGTGYRIASVTRVSGGSGYQTDPIPPAAPANLAPYIKINNTNGELSGAMAGVYFVMTGTGTISTATLSNGGAFYPSNAGNIPYTVTGNANSLKGSGAQLTFTVVPIDPTVANLPSGLDKEDFLKEIQDERMREFAFEQMRKFDLIRWGIFKDEMEVVYNNVMENSPANYANEVFNRFKNAQNPRNVLWPIPAQEIMMNRKMVQNPGW